jgi:hypothetical protein
MDWALQLQMIKGTHDHGVHAASHHIIALVAVILLLFMYVPPSVIILRHYTDSEFHGNVLACDGPQRNSWMALPLL